MASIRRQFGAWLRFASCLSICGIAAAQSDSSGEILTLELRPNSDSVRAGIAAPAPRRFFVPRGMVRNPPQPDADGVYRRAAFGLLLGETPKDGVAAIQFQSATPKEWEFSTLVPMAGDSPLPGLRPFENRDPRSLGQLYAASDARSGVIYATCVELMPSKPPPVCVLQASLDSEVAVLVTVRQARFAEWRELLRRALERVSTLQTK